MSCTKRCCNPGIIPRMLTMKPFHGEYASKDQICSSGLKVHPAESPQPPQSCKYLEQVYGSKPQGFGLGSPRPILKCENGSSPKKQLRFGNGSLRIKGQKCLGGTTRRVLGFWEAPHTMKGRQMHILPWRVSWKAGKGLWDCSPGSYRGC